MARSLEYAGAWAFEAQPMKWTSEAAPRSSSSRRPRSASAWSVETRYLKTISSEAAFAMRSHESGLAAGAGAGGPFSPSQAIR